MKRLLGSLAMALAIGTGHCALHAQRHDLPAHQARDTNLTGAWTLTVADFSMAMVLNQDGASISGSLDSPHGAMRVAGEVHGDAVSFSGSTATAPTVEISASGNAKADGSLEGTLTVNVGDGPMPWTATRAAAK